MFWVVRVDRSGMARSDTSPSKRPRRAPIATAPRDGSLVRVAIRASEQGPAEFDTVRWSRSETSGQEGWVAFDSDPDARIVYSDGEIAYWLPLPSQTAKRARARRSRPKGTQDESDGSAI
jgi:hypothetical protein